MKAKLGVKQTVTRDHAVSLDRADPLGGMRDAFDLPAGIIYLNGNSLGPLSHGVRTRLSDVVDREWKEGLTRSWNSAGWFLKPDTVGGRLGKLIGAKPGEVAICDSTSVNLFKVLVAALNLRPGRNVIVSDAANFPTDLYIAQGVRSLLPGTILRLIGPDGTLDELLDDSVAAVLLTHVDYKTGAMADMAAITERARKSGALMIWDLAHSAGAVPVDLSDARVDLAIGCTYKYLNSGPGGPAFVFVAERHQAAALQPLYGWHGHAAPFDFSLEYEPAQGIRRFLCGTPSILSFAPLEASLDIWERVSMDDVRAKSLSLSDLFIEIVEERCQGTGLTLVTPREHGARGSQVSFRHPQSYAIMQALIELGVVGDFRAPDLLRFGFAPLFLSHENIFDAGRRLAEVLKNGSWEEVKYQQRKLVT